MFRDFSDSSKQQLLNLVSEVENEKKSDFTDWVGDRWYDFETWIGKLDIKNYINNVNAYHKKVIDKNNATTKSINSIFSKVESVDKSYKYKLAATRTSLNKCLQHINQLIEIVNPSNGKFNAKDKLNRKSGVYMNVNEYMSKFMKEHINQIVGPFAEIPRVWSTSLTDQFLELEVNLISSGEMPSTKRTLPELLTSGKSLFKDISTYVKALGAETKNDKITLSSSILSYISSLCGVGNNILSSESKSSKDLMSSWLSLFKSSTGVELGIYKYFEKTLKNADGSQNISAVKALDEKFGGLMSGLSIASGAAGVADKGVDAYEVFVDPDSTTQDKVGESINVAGSIAGLGEKIYVAVQSTDKKVYSTWKGNQILATPSDDVYAVSKTASKKISKASTALGIVEVVTSTVSSGVKKAGELSSDGDIDMGDVGSIGVNASLAGIDTVINKLTKGLVDIDSEQIAVDLETKVDDFVMRDNWASEFIKNEEHSKAARVVVSMGSAVYILGEEAKDGIVNGAKSTVSWISSKYSTVKGWFN